MGEYGDIRLDIGQFFKEFTEAKGAIEKSAKDLGVPYESLLKFIKDGGLVDLIKLAETDLKPRGGSVPDGEFVHPVDAYLKPEFRLKREYVDKVCDLFGRFFYYERMGEVRLGRCVTRETFINFKGYGWHWEFEYNGFKGFPTSKQVYGWNVGELLREETDIQIILKEFCTPDMIL